LRVFFRYGGLDEWAIATPVPTPGQATGQATGQTGQAAQQAPWSQAPLPKGKPPAGLATQASWRPAGNAATTGKAPANQVSFNTAPTEREKASGQSSTPGKLTTKAKSPKSDGNGNGAGPLGGPHVPTVGASGFFKGQGQVTNKS
jgi:hypothetical protein